jgi:hypothetical protein
MNMKKTVATLCTILAVGTSLAMPVSAQWTPEQQLSAQPNDPSIEIFQLFWSIAYDADVTITIEGGSAVAQLTYDKPSAATASMRIRIYSKASGGSWTLATSSSSASASCSTADGYQYKVEATLTLKMNGETEVINLADGPYTA